MLVQFYTNVSHIQAECCCSDVMHVMAPNASVIVVQLIFDFPDGRAERREFRCGLDGHRKQFTLYRHRLHYTISIGEPECP